MIPVVYLLNRLSCMNIDMNIDYYYYYYNYYPSDGQGGGGGGGGIHPPTGFSNFSQKWEELFAN